MLALLLCAFHEIKLNKLWDDVCVGLREWGGGVHWGKGQKKICGLLFYIFYSWYLERPRTTALIVGETGTFPRCQRLSAHMTSFEGATVSAQS